MEDCIFCKIVNKEIPAKIIYEDDKFLVIPDLNPQAKVHVLIITKQHIPSLAEAAEYDKEIIEQLLWTAKIVAKQLDLSAYRIVLNTGNEAGQTIKHLHLHLLGGEALGSIA